MARPPVAAVGFALAALAYAAVTAQFVARFGMNPFAAAYGFVGVGLGSTSAAFILQRPRDVRFALQGGLACGGLAYAFVILRTFLTGTPSLYTLADAILALAFLQAAGGAGEGVPSEADDEDAFRFNAALAAGGGTLLGLLSLFDGSSGVALGFLAAATGFGLAARRGSWRLTRDGMPGEPSSH